MRIISNGREWQRDQFSVCDVSRPPFNANRTFSRWEETRKPKYLISCHDLQLICTDYFFILFTCFCSYASQRKKIERPK